MKIVIAGYGAVGKSIDFALKFHSKVERFIDDPALGKNYDVSVGGVPDGVVVCVATPQSEDGSCTTKHVEEVFKKYGNTKYLIKSAVDPVFLTDWASREDGSYTCSPEFLRGSNTHGDATKEFLNQDFAIYGGDDCRWWDEIFKVCLPKLERVRYISLEQAAFAKYVENTFLATKVTFFNEMYKIFHEVGFTGFDQMVEAITLDKRIGISHTQVPGPDGKFGFGGHCLPKDLAALRYISSDTPLLDAVTDINSELRDE